MKVKFEYLFIIIVFLFVAGYGLDWINGYITLPLTGPYQFIDPDTLTKYPLTSVSISLKVLGFWLSSILVFQLFRKKYLLKTAILFIYGVLTQFYAIQQIATHQRVTPLEWTLALAYSGILALITAIPFLVLGMFELIRTKPKMYSVTSPTHAKKDDDNPKSFEFGID